LNAEFINIHTHQQVSREAELAVMNYFPNQLSNSPSGYFSVGIHPCDVEYEKQFFVLEELLQHQHPQAIGECGFDRNSPLPIAIQTIIFNRQAEIAETLHIPVIIHCVGRFQELIASRKILKPTLPWIIHGFTGSWQLAKQLIDAGFLLSFGFAILTGKGKAEESLKYIPSNTFFLETDDDARFSIADIYVKAAEIRGVAEATLIQQIDTLFRTIF